MANILVYEENLKNYTIPTERLKRLLILVLQQISQYQKDSIWNFVSLLLIIVSIEYSEKKLLAATTIK